MNILVYTKIQMLYTLFEFLFCYNINRPQRRSCSEDYEDDNEESFMNCHDANELLFGTYEIV